MDQLMIRRGQIDMYMCMYIQTVINYKEFQPISMYSNSVLKYQKNDSWKALEDMQHLAAVYYNYDKKTYAVIVLAVISVQRL